MTLDDLIVSIGVDTDELESGTEEGVTRANSHLGNLGRGVAGLAAGLSVGKLFADGLDAGVEIAKVDTSLKTKFGLTEKEAQSAGDIAGHAYAGGFSDSIEEAGEAVGQVQQAIGGMGKVSNKTLQGMTNDALALSKTYGSDVGDVTKAVGQMLKTGMAKDGSQALDILAAGFQKGVNKSDDLLDTFNEYGTQFRKLGLDGTTAMGLLSQGLQGGARDADLVADSLKEFSIRAVDGSTTTAQGFKMLGLNARKMSEQIGKGGKGASAGLDTVLARLRGIKDPVKQSQAAVALFGTQAEDLGKALYSIDPSTAVKALGNVKGAADSAAQSVSASQSMTVIWRTMATTIGEQLAPVLEWLGAFMSKHPALVQAVVVVLLALAIAFGVVTVATWAMNSAMLANPITWVIALVVALIAIGVLLYKNWDTVKAYLLGAWGAIRSGFGAGWSWMKSNVFYPIGSFFTKTIPGWVSTGASYITSKWNSLVGFFRGVPGAMNKAFSGAFDGLKNAFRSAVNWIIGGWNRLSFSIPGVDTHIPGVGNVGGFTMGTPNIPYLATGGVTTGPTMAMIGEGRENEAVLPLSKLNGMLNSARVQGVTSANAQSRIVFDVTGADEDMKRLIRRIVKNDGRGNVQTAFGQR